MYCRGLMDDCSSEQKYVCKLFLMDFCKQMRVYDFPSIIKVNLQWSSIFVPGRTASSQAVNGDQGKINYKDVKSFTCWNPNNGTFSLWDCWMDLATFGVFFDKQGHVMKHLGAFFILTCYILSLCVNAVRLIARRPLCCPLHACLSQQRGLMLH